MKATIITYDEFNTEINTKVYISKRIEPHFSSQIKFFLTLILDKNRNILKKERQKYTSNVSAIIQAV